MTQPQYDGLAFKVCLYLSARPRGAGMFTGEIAQRWGCPQRSIRTRLSRAIENGWLDVDVIRGESQRWISVGPALMELMKEAA